MYSAESKYFQYLKYCADINFVPEILKDFLLSLVEVKLKHVNWPLTGFPTFFAYQYETIRALKII